MKKYLLALILPTVFVLSCKKDKYHEIIVVETAVTAKTDSLGKPIRFMDMVTFRSNLTPTVEVRNGDSLQIDNKLDKMQNNIYTYRSHRLPNTKNYILVLKNDEYTFDFKMLWEGLK